MRWIWMGLLACAACAAPHTGDDTVDGGLGGHGKVLDAGIDGAVVQTPDSAVASNEPLGGVYDETATLVSDSCGTQWDSPSMMVEVVQVMTSTLTFTNTMGQSVTYTRTDPMTFDARPGMAVNHGTWTSNMSYMYTSTYSYVDSGRSCTAVFSAVGIRRP